MKRARIILTISFTVVCAVLFAEERAGEKYSTKVYDPTIKTLRVKYLEANQPERTFLHLGSDEVLDISFDQLSHNTHQYTYRLLHLNANWTESGLMTSEYMEGFPTADITDYDFSVNTQQIYTHYRFEFPSGDMRPKVSGNYAIQIYEDGDTDKTVAVACFSVTEDIAGVAVNVRSNTDIELSGRYQQLDIDVNTKYLRITNADDIILFVEQNGRVDNSVFQPKPTYIEANRLRYVNNKQLIFEGGNEYRHFDDNSVYIKGHNVDKILFDRNDYHAILFLDEMRHEEAYMTEYDANGQWIVHAERSDDDDYEAEYLWVHFQLDAPKPYFDGTIYLTGDLTLNEFSPQTRLQYDADQRVYYTALYLKQGAYDYQYLFMPKGETKGTLLRTEGSHWQTQNEYTIYVYYRPFGARYDRLVGIKRVQ